jgi:hypothetical protein
MQESWKQVSGLVEELKVLLLRSGVPERQVSMPHDTDPNVIPLEKYNDIFDWLHKFKLSDEWVAAMKVWNLVPPKQWAGYDLHEVTGLQEQILLEAALSKLRKRWKLERPSFFGRKFRAKGDKGEDAELEGIEENPDGLCEESEGETV